MDQYNISIYSNDLYKDFKEIWESSYEDVPPESALPSVGFVVGDKKLIGFIANTDCDFMICTWYACNPNNSKRESYNSLKKYFMACKEYAKYSGKKHLFVYSNYSGIIRLLKSLNFHSIEKGHMACKVI